MQLAAAAGLTLAPNTKHSTAQHNTNNNERRQSAPVSFIAFSIESNRAPTCPNLTAHFTHLHVRAEFPSNMCFCVLCLCRLRNVREGKRPRGASRSWRRNARPSANSGYVQLKCKLKLSLLNMLALHTCCVLWVLSVVVQEAERERELDERRRLLEERQRLEGEARRAKQLEQDVILNRGAAQRPKLSLSFAAPASRLAQSQSASAAQNHKTWAGDVNASLSPLPRTRFDYVYCTRLSVLHVALTNAFLSTFASPLLFSLLL